MFLKEKARHFLLLNSETDKFGKAQSKIKAYLFFCRRFIDNMVMLKLSTANHAMNAVDEMRALNTDVKKIMDKNGAEYPVWREL